MNLNVVMKVKCQMMMLKVDSSQWTIGYVNEISRMCGQV